MKDWPFTRVRHSFGYNTYLTPQQEQQFKTFVFKNVHPLDQQAALQGVSDYDYRGALLDSLAGMLGGNYDAHFVDTYKKPNHESFSNQSIYANQYNNPGQWVGLYNPEYINGIKAFTQRYR